MTKTKRKTSQTWKTQTAIKRISTRTKKMMTTIKKAAIRMNLKKAKGKWILIKTSEKGESWLL